MQKVRQSYVTIATHFRSPTPSYSSSSTTAFTCQAGRPWKNANICKIYACKNCCAPLSF